LQGDAFGAGLFLSYPCLHRFFIKHTLKRVGIWIPDFSSGRTQLGFFSEEHMWCRLAHATRLGLVSYQEINDFVHLSASFFQNSFSNFRIRTHTDCNGHQKAVKPELVKRQKTGNSELEVTSLWVELSKSPFRRKWCHKTVDCRLECTKCEIPYSRNPETSIFFWTVELPNLLLPRSIQCTTANYLWDFGNVLENLQRFKRESVSKKFTLGIRRFGSVQGRFASLSDRKWRKSIAVSNMGKEKRVSTIGMIIEVPK
jgi:hypothetical protein